MATPTATTLGCSKHVAYVQNKCNGRRLCELVDASEITYNRVLDDISEATVSIPLSGDATTPCCQCLADVEPWCHQLTIVREGDGVVWTGPIQKITYGRDQVTISAKDKLAWLLYRVNEITIPGPAFAPWVNPNTTYSMTNMAVDIIEVAMAEDADSPCFIDGNSLIDNCVTNCNGIINLGDDRPVGFPRSFQFDAFGGPTAFDDLVQLGQSGIDFTVINQVLILKSEDLPTRAIGILTDDLILGDLEITKDGTIMANRVFVRYEGDDDCAGSCGGAPSGAGCPCPGFQEAPEQCYGAIERIFDGLGAQDKASAETIAARYIERGSIAPRLIELPSGTRLSPECNFGINELIPGQRMDVALTTFCFPVFQKFKLQGMSVTDNGTEEVITVDLLTVESTA